MWRTLYGIATLATWLWLSECSRAEYAFEFGAAGSSPQTSFTIGSVGGTVDIQVYLRELNGGTVLATDGLFGSGVLVDFDSSIVSVSLITGNPEFNSILSSISSGQASLNVVKAEYPWAVYPDPLTPNRILLGTFTFTGLAPGIAVIDVQDPPTHDTITGNGELLDPISSGSGTITVAPEPNGLLTMISLGASAGIGSLTWRGWRRRKQGIVG